jgi:ABC-type nickel/cobalt efflux system permease component RcnA
MCKAFALGVAMVAAFSAGLALTLVMIGASVAVGLAQRRSRSGPTSIAGRNGLPYISAGVVMVMGLALHCRRIEQACCSKRASPLS